MGCCFYFAATLGTSLDEFAADVRAILDAKLKNP
jgi:hypothetical protein